MRDDLDQDQSDQSESPPRGQAKGDHLSSYPTTKWVFYKVKTTSFSNPTFLRIAGHNTVYCLRPKGTRCWGARPAHYTSCRGSSATRNDHERSECSMGAPRAHQTIACLDCVQKATIQCILIVNLQRRRYIVRATSTGTRRVEVVYCFARYRNA